MVLEGYRYVEGLGSFASSTFSLLFVVCVPLVLMNVFLIKTKNKNSFIPSLNLDGRIWSLDSCHVYSCKSFFYLLTYQLLLRSRISCPHILSHT